MCLYVCTIVSVEGIMPQRDSMHFSGTRCNSIGLNALLAGRFLEDPQIYRNLVDYMIWVRCVLPCSLKVKVQPLRGTSEEFFRRIMASQIYCWRFDEIAKQQLTN